MNAGMFGMGDGGVGQPRKLTGRLGYNPDGTVYSIDTNAIFMAGLACPFVTLAAPSARTKVLNISGKGALRWLAVLAGSAGTPGFLRLEVVVDGSPFINWRLNPSGTGEGPVVVGGMASPYNATAGGANRSTHIPDYLPFNNSLEIYATWDTGSVNGLYLPSIIDIHQ